MDTTVEGCILDDNGNALDPITYVLIPPERLIKVKTGDTIHCFDLDTLFRSMYSAKGALINPYNRQPFTEQVTTRVKEYGDSISYNYTLIAPIHPPSDLVTKEIKSSVPGFVRVGEFIVKLMTEANTVVIQGDYIPLLQAMELTIDGHSLMVLVANGSIDLNEPVAMVNFTERFGSTIKLLKIWEDRPVEQYLQLLQAYTYRHATGECDDNYTIYQVITKILDNGDNESAELSPLEEMLEAVNSGNAELIWLFISDVGNRLIDTDIEQLSPADLSKCYKQIVELNLPYADSSSYAMQVGLLGPLLYVVALLMDALRTPHHLIKFNPNMEVCYNVTPKVDVVSCYVQHCYQRDIGIPDSNFKYQDYQSLRLSRANIFNLTTAAFGSIRRDTIGSLIIILEEAKATHNLEQVLVQLSKRKDFQLLVQHNDLSDALNYRAASTDWLVNVIPANTSNVVLKQLRQSLV